LTASTPGTAGGRLVVAPRTAACPAGCRGVHSYVADGRRVCWRPDAPGRHSVDAEIADAPVPEALGRRFGEAHFWDSWTRSEALAKLAGVPILLWLSRRGLEASAPPGVRTRHLRLGDLVVSTASAVG
jgi:hypothetical protein